jgi:hypothetical protein
MIELYLISVFGCLATLVTILCIASGFGFFLGLITKIIFSENPNHEDYLISCKLFKISKMPFIITLFLSVLTPSKSQLYMIFGIGPVIDNIQNSDVAKQLPDKTIQVLDKWCDEYLKDNSHVSNNK